MNVNNVKDKKDGIRIGVLRKSERARDELQVRRLIAPERSAECVFVGDVPQDPQKSERKN